MNALVRQYPKNKYCDKMAFTSALIGHDPLFLQVVMDRSIDRHRSTSIDIDRHRSTSIDRDCRSIRSTSVGIDRHREYRSIRSSIACRVSGPRPSLNLLDLPEVPGPERGRGDFSILPHRRGLWGGSSTDRPIARSLDPRRRSVAQGDEQEASTARPSPPLESSLSLTDRCTTPSMLRLLPSSSIVFHLCHLLPSSSISATFFHLLPSSASSSATAARRSRSSASRRSASSRRTTRTCTRSA